MIVVKENNEYLIEMSNVRGNYVKNPGKLNFSFYFSSGSCVNHSIRVKPSFNPEKILMSKTGTLKLSGDWEFIPGKDDNRISITDINEMKKFFKDRIVLFCMVWDEQLDDGSLEDFFNGIISLNKLIKNSSFYEEYKDILEDINTIEDLERFARDRNIVNFYGN